MVNSQNIKITSRIRQATNLKYLEDIASFEKSIDEFDFSISVNRQSRRRIRFFSFSTIEFIIYLFLELILRLDKVDYILVSEYLKI